MMEPVPYKQYIELRDIQLFYNDVGLNGVRPSLERVQEIFHNLLIEMWQDSVNRRIDFRTIYENVKDFVVDVPVPSVSARLFWKQYFDDKVEVRFDDFITKLKKFLDLSDNEFYLIDEPEYHEGQIKCLKLIFCCYSTSNVVTLEQYGRVIEWFGSLRDEDTLPKRILAICHSNWFFGDITREDAEKHFRNTQKKKSF